MKLIHFVIGLSNAAEIMRDLAILVACLVYIQPAPESDGSAGSVAYRGERDGQVWVAIDDREFGFAPNVARAVAADLVEGADTLESN